MLNNLTIERLVFGLNNGRPNSWQPVHNLLLQLHAIAPELPPGEVSRPKAIYHSFGWIFLRCWQQLGSSMVALLLSLIEPSPPDSTHTNF